MKPIEHFLDRVICGDCLEVIKGIPDNSVDCVITDPPYGVDYNEWDEFNGLNWLSITRRKFTNVAFTCGHKNMYNYPEPNCLAIIVRLGSIQLQKEGGGFSHWEPLLIYGERLPNPDVVKIKANTNAKHYGHPCAKSLELYKWIILKLTKENDIILDPFLGSGTTAVACKQLNRRFIGIEISPEYCKIAEQRLRDTDPLFHQPHIKQGELLK